MKVGGSPAFLNREIMFKNLRQGQVIYILHKDDKMYYEVATIVSIDNLRPKVPMMNAPYMQQEMLVDIKAKVGNDNINIPSVPADLVVTDYKPSNGDKMVLACDLNAFNTEINSMLQNSQAILASIDKHKSIIDSCEIMLAQLNPQFAKDKERDQEMSEMRERMSSLQDTNAQLMSMMKELLDKQSTNNKKATT